MKTTNVAAGAMLASAASAALPEGVVQFDVGRRSAHPKLTRRATANTDSSTIDNNLSQGGYFATCKIGTPQQTLTLQLDTGSSDIWVPSSSASVCASSEGCSLGSFNSDDSSTFVVVGKDEFSISYVDGSHSDGSYFTDVFTIGGSTVTNMTMGLGQSTDINFGLVGIGYKTDEAIVSTTQSLSSAYNNLPLVMVQEGVIKTNAYSLWLNDLEASTGNLLFGGIDTDKYKGDLTKINVYKDPNTNTFTSFIVALTSVNAVSTSGDDALTSTAFPVPVVLDSGTTLSYVPQDMAEEIWKEVGAEYDAEVQLAVIPCSMASSGGHFTFGFGGTNGATIDVGMDELVLDIATSSGPGGPGGPTFSSGRFKGQSACEFGIQNSSEPYLLGDTFLRSAYVVYDLVNNQIALGQTNFNATSSNIVAFASSGAPIPSATAAPSQAQITQTSSFTEPAYAAQSGFASSATASAGSSSSGGGGGGSSKNAAGVNAVPIGLLHIGAISATMFIAGGLFIM
ncbi:hypothetical protein HMPREF1624_03098 [Sporothrix schenckii ATCC 58251]|uniref:Probable aspartic-type endopeptidase OPSB n=1 Tax=Sporothrix schenckii (strain ATCC 58251 / de Perez 2211183) TaxID=1391915 RepID=U7PYB6_SPOS1|nr:hypothetical protein HMPREF1624_03098 [Sporothrix schenckii ATCC 58251]